MSSQTSFKEKKIYIHNVLNMGADKPNGEKESITRIESIGIQRSNLPQLRGTWTTHDIELGVT